MIKQPKYFSFASDLLEAIREEQDAQETYEWAVYLVEQLETFVPKGELRAIIEECFDGYIYQHGDFEGEDDE